VFFWVVFTGTYALSVLDTVDGERSVKHYYIRNMDNGGFYIAAKYPFDSLSELVQFYSRQYRPNCMV